MSAPTRPAASLGLLIAGLVLVSLNLRPALSSVSPVLAWIQASLGLSATAAGLLTTLPVLCLGLFAPLAPRLAGRWGSERTVFVVLLVLAAGTALRAVLGAGGLFLGALLAGASIGIIGVLLPSLIKRDFPQHIGPMMGLYTMALCLGAALAAGATVPLMQAFGGSWRAALAAWAVLALIAAALWWPQVRQPAGAAPAPPGAPLWGDRLAWAVTLYMGLQSALAYCVFGWLAPLLSARGVEPLHAGLVVSVSVLVQLLTAFTGPWLAMRWGTDQRPTLLLMLGLALAGWWGCVAGPLDGLWLWAVLQGLGQGGQFSVALLLIVLRSPDAPTAARLSGMSQGVGYGLASLGPLALGFSHDLLGDWSAAGPLFTAITLGAAAAGWFAAQHRWVSAR
ncbi:MFS transporter [Caldimonas taiwanensis]|uniref:MFS transporter n=1 Tax=Caldimonas taiwanensis TaxID=307483 RepID=UPI000B2EE3B7|nr:MFS transporter [Caldimonas taiwanensis]